MISIRSCVLAMCQLVNEQEGDIDSSLGYQANGRLRPADKKDIAKLTIKTFICPECGNSIELGSKSFGETVLCPECKNPMYQKWIII